MTQILAERGRFGHFVQMFKAITIECFGYRVLLMYVTDM